MGLAFLLTSLVIVATPGTGALLSIAAGLRGGRRSSIITALGCTLGTVPHLVAAITGAAAILHSSGVAFATLKWLGVCCLLYMAWATWRDDEALKLQEDTPSSAWRMILSAVLANLLNPKLTLFFFAFLPQFVPEGAEHPVLHMAALSLVFMAMTFVVFTGYGFFATAARRHLIDRPRLVRRIQRAFSVSFVGLSTKLATTRY